MDPEEIEEEFESSCQEIFSESEEFINTEEDEETEEDLTKNIQQNTETWRFILVFSFLCLCSYCFISFLPIKLVTPGGVWEKYINECCDLKHCSFFSGCEKHLNLWMKLSNANRDILNDCCYWYAPYRENIRSYPYCNYTCIKSD